MKKRLLYYVSLTLVTLLLSVCLYSKCTYSSFDSSKVYNDITLLSSSTYSGRLPGSSENVQVGEYIQNIFMKNGTTPLNSDYKENFTLPCPIKTNTEPYLNISKDGKTLETLKYGQDFKEDMINFNKNKITFTGADVFKVNTYTIQIQNSEGTFLLFTPDNDNLSFRSSFSADFPYDCVVMITSQTYGKIINAIKENCEISLQIPFTTETKTISNIVGVLEGKNNSLPPIILTAHYDHLGMDGNGSLYGGALDNASGISFLLELQKNIASLGTPERDIIFVALNAEEFGLKGSEAFAISNKDKIKDAQVINFDMVGSEGYPITLMMPSCLENKSCDLLTEINEICKDNKIETTLEYKDSSDHASFGNIGLESLTLSHSDMRFIHTPEDKIEHISTDAIDSVYNVVYEKVVNDSFSKVTIFYQSNLLLCITSGCFLLLLFIPIYEKIKKNNV